MASSSTRVALVTGSTDGIGRHTATRLAKEGFRVFIHGRDPKRIQDTMEQIRSQVPGADLESFQADFASLADVRRLGEEVQAKCDKLDVLINNAGVFEQSMKKTVDGNEFVFQVNVLAPFLLTSVLLETVSKATNPRIIIVSSISQGSRIDFDNLQMEKGFSDHGSYSLSKLCNAMHTMELADRLKKARPHITCNTLDPGTVNTKMLLAGWGACGIDVSQANNQFRLATSPDLEGVTGQYFLGSRASKASSPAYDLEQRQKLWGIMEQLTGAVYAL